MKQFKDCEDRIARLQVVQARYNLSVEVDVLGERMTLCEVVKRVGGAGRAEKMWRAAAGGKKKDRYSYRDDLTRNKDQERAERTVSIEEALGHARTAGKYASALREALQVANGIEIEIEGLDSSLFE